MTLYLTYRVGKWFAYSMRPIRWNSAADADTALSGLIDGLRMIGCRAEIRRIERPNRKFLEGLTDEQDEYGNC